MSDYFTHGVCFFKETDHFRRSPHVIRGETTGNNDRIKLLDDIFEVTAAKPGKLTLETYDTNDAVEIEIKVPLKLSKLCRVGWQMNLLLVKTSKGWIIDEAGRISY